MSVQLLLREKRFGWVFQLSGRTVGTVKLIMPARHAFLLWLFGKGKYAGTHTHTHTKFIGWLHLFSAVAFKLTVLLKPRR